MDRTLYLIVIISILFKTNRAEYEYEYESENDIQEAVQSSDISSKGTRLVGARRASMNRDNVRFVASIATVNKH